MAQSLLELIFKTSKQGQGGKAAAAELKEVKGAVGEITSGLGLFNVGSLTAMGAVAGLAAFAKDSVGDWSKYAEEMGKAADISGITAEDMSRITQAADDMRVPVESLQKAFEIANKNGFQPSIENLADLADRVKGMNSPTERAAELSKIFGKGWADIYPLLKDGGQAIRDNTAAIDDSLVVTGKAVEANKDYLAQLDDLQDQWQGVKNTAGQALIPILGDVLGYVNNGTAALKEQDTAWGRVLAGVPLVGQVYLGVIGHQYELEQATLDSGKALLDFNTNMDVGAGFADTFGSAVSGAADVVNGELVPSLDDVKASFSKLTDQMIFNKAAANLSAEGALELARGLGLVDETSLYAQQSIDTLTQQYKDGEITEEEYIARLETIKRTIDGINSKDVTIRVDTWYTEHNAKDATGKNINPQQTDYQDYMGKANAGTFMVPAGFPDDSFQMGLSSGETVSVVNDRMRWTGEGQGGGRVVNIEKVEIRNEMDYRTFVARLKNDLKI